MFIVLSKMCKNLYKKLENIANKIFKNRNKQRSIPYCGFEISIIKKFVFPKVIFQFKGQSPAINFQYLAS